MSTALFENINELAIAKSTVRMCNVHFNGRDL